MISFSHRIAFLSAAVVFISPIWAHRDTPKAEPPNYTLTSPEPFHAVHIPFALDKGRIFVDVTIDGKTLPWQFDTGSTDSVWPRGSISGKEIGGKETFSEAFGEKHDSYRTTFPSMHLGNYERLHTSGYSVQLTEAERADEAKRSVRMLANSVFSQVVVTLDYEKRELIVRSPDYNPAKDPTLKDSVALSFKRKTTDPQNECGWVTISGVVGNKPQELALDTGFTADPFGVVLSPSKYETMVSLLKTQFPDFLAGTTSNTTSTLSRTERMALNITSAVPVTLGNPALTSLSVKSGLLKAETEIPLVDGIIGWSILRNYRITLDYPRQKIYFQKNASVVSEPHPLGPAFKDGVPYVVWSDGTWTRIEPIKQEKIVP